MNNTVNKKKNTHLLIEKKKNIDALYNMAVIIIRTANIA